MGNNFDEAKRKCLCIKNYEEINQSKFVFELVEREREGVREMQRDKPNVSESHRETECTADVVYHIYIQTHLSTMVPATSPPNSLIFFKTQKNPRRAPI